MIATLSDSSFMAIISLPSSSVSDCADFSSIAPRRQCAREALSHSGADQYHRRIVAAINPIGTPAENQGENSSRLMNFIKLAIILIIVGGSVWLLIEHRQWFDDPALVKSQVVAW